MNKLILGHRGYSEIAPENTQISFAAAKLFDFDGIEIDLHKTKDNHLVVIHDETIERTSDGEGFVKDLTLEELRKFNFAAKFNTALPKQTILTYEEFLNEFGNEFKCLNVEIKTDIVHYKNIEQLIWDTHMKVKPKAEIIYSSFNFHSLKVLRAITQEAKLGFLFVDDRDILYIKKELLEICDFIHPWFKSLATKRSMDFYKTLNLPINPWTYDTSNNKNKWVYGSKTMIDDAKKNKLIYALISNSKI